MAARVPGLGDSGAIGSIFGFFPALVTAAGGVVGSVPGILAATGDKKAVAYADQLASLDCSKNGGQWVPATRDAGGYCDMSAVVAARAQQAQADAESSWIKSWAFPAVLGLGAVGLTYATVQAFRKGRV